MLALLPYQLIIINYLHSKTFQNDCLATLYLLELFLELDLQIGICNKIVIVSIVINNHCII